MGTAPSAQRGRTREKKEYKMETKRVPFEELPITDRFMFAMVFSHKEIAQPFLEAVLGIKIHELKEPEPEKTVEVSPFYKGIRTMSL